KANEKELLAEWIKAQLGSATLRPDLLKESDLREQSRSFLSVLQKSLRPGASDGEAKDFLADVSRSRAQAGFSPSETALFVFSLKEPLFGLLRRELKDGEALVRELLSATALLDSLVLYTTEVYQQSR